MAQAPVAPVVLVILDGWGYRPDIHGNAIAQGTYKNKIIPRFSRYLIIIE